MEPTLGEWTAAGYAVGAPQDATTKCGRGLGTEEQARGSIRLSFIELMVQEEVVVKGHPGHRYGSQL